MLRDGYRGVENVVQKWLDTNPSRDLQRTMESSLPKSSRHHGDDSKPKMKAEQKYSFAMQDLSDEQLQTVLALLGIDKSASI
jgi:hypothetical protein